MGKKKKNQIHKFFPTIYPRKLWVAKKLSLEQVNDVFSSYNGGEVDDEWDDKMIGISKAIVFKAMERKSGEYGVFVLINDSLNIADIAHESVHVASCIFDDCGMTMGFGGGKDEHFAYLVGFVADCIYQVVTGRFRD